MFCNKHGLEVVWHRYVKLRDGLTKGPSTFNGKVCRELEGESFWTEDIVNFTNIKPADVPTVSEEDLAIL